VRINNIRLTMPNPIANNSRLVLSIF